MLKIPLQHGSNSFCETHGVVPEKLAGRDVLLVWVRVSLAALNVTISHKTPVPWFSYKYRIFTPIGGFELRH